ncbi:MAG: glucose 1-dehydrogenase [Phycisphaerales bacterium]
MASASGMGTGSLSGSMAGKVAIVTGGTSGMGKSSAELFARAGANVVLTGRREKEGNAVADAINALGGKANGFGEVMYVRADAAIEADSKRVVDETVKRFGRLDYAFNNAGVEGALATPTTEQTETNFRHVFDINVLGVLMSMKYQIPAILKSVAGGGSGGGGAIVNNASVAGSRGMEGFGVYVASKHAVLGLTKSASLEYSKHGIRINAVSPAVIETEMADRFLDALGGEEAKKYMTSLHPIGRLGQDHEIARAAVWLCSNEASFITGTDLKVDGGFTSK